MEHDDTNGPSYIFLFEFCGLALVSGALVLVRLRSSRQYRPWHRGRHGDLLRHLRAAHDDAAILETAAGTGSGQSRGALTRPTIKLIRKGPAGPSRATVTQGNPDSRKSSGASIGASGPPARLLGACGCRASRRSASCSGPDAVRDPPGPLDWMRIASHRRIVSIRAARRGMAYRSS